MINGFEKETQPLTAYELALIEPITRSFLKYIGKASCISNRTICDKINEAIKNGRIDIDRKFKLTSVRLRKIIHHIRCNELVPLLCSNSNGYFIAQSPQEVEEYVKGLKHRIEATQQVSKALLEQYYKKYGQQKLVI